MLSVILNVMLVAVLNVMFGATLECRCAEYLMLSVMLGFIIPRVITQCHYATLIIILLCHYAVCRHAECLKAECHGDKF
jgi:hypothetical protein